jgi:hypothetical protein
MPRPRSSATLRWTISDSASTGFGVHKDVHLHKIALARADLFVIEAGIAAAEIDFSRS